MRRSAIFLLMGALVCAAEAVAADSFARAVEITPEKALATPQRVEIMGALVLATKAPDGSPVTGLSGLAWDRDELILYALSDRGRLLHLRPRFDNDRLTDVEYLAGFRLLDKDGRRLRGEGRDSEGLVVRNGDNGRRGDSELLVSFERFPRIARYSATGQMLGEVDLPLALQKRDAYASTNKALESLADHPQLGLLTAPETAMGDGDLSIWAVDGRRWHYTPAPALGSSVVDMEALPDGRLVVLERAFVSPLWPLVISLRLAELGTETAAGVSTLVTLDGADGWRLDNFEGLAWHAGDRFFMVSDDNGSDLQRTLLVYLRLSDLQ